LPMDEPLKKGIDGLSDKIKSQSGIKTLSLYEDRKGNIKLNSIIIDKEARGQGVGSDVMEQIISYADKEGKQVQLTPALKDDYQGTTSQSRLKKFYKRFGFVENKGRNKDFSISELMYRNPNKIAGVGGGALLVGITPEEAKAAPLEQQMLEAEALDQEGLTVDAEYSQVLNEISKAEDDVAWASLDLEDTKTEEKETPKAEEGDGFLADVGEGIIEMPLQTIGGIADAVNETLDLTKELGDWLNENVVDLGGVVVNDDGISLASGEELAEADNIQIPTVSGEELSETDNIQIPTTDKADSVTGGLIRGISQFVAGFIGAGKLKPMQALKPATTAGKIGKAALQGAIADFTVFDPQEERLSNLVESSPALQNPVTEFLAASPDDNAAEGRFKNAVEGLGIGVAVDGLLTGLKVLRNARIAKREAQAIEKEAIKENAFESGFGSKQGESFDPEITPEQIQAAIDGFEPKPKDLTEVDVSPEDLINRPNVDVDEGEVFVNWSRIDSPEDVKALMRDMADKMQPEIDEARRGKQSFEQMKLNAEGVDAWETLSNRRQGQPLNAEQSIAARELWATSQPNGI